MAEPAQAGGVAFAERFERAGEAVPQVKPDEDHGDDIPERGPRRLKDLEHQTRQIAHGRFGGDGVMWAVFKGPEMKWYKNEHDEARQNHGGRGEALAAGESGPPFVAVGLGPRLPIHARDRNAAHHVEKVQNEKTQLGHHDERIGDEGMAVVIKGIDAAEEQQIAGEMGDEKKKQQQTTRAHQELTTKRGCQHTHESSHS